MTDWSSVEDFLHASFGDRKRKNGQPMVEHSLRIGRALAAKGHDAVTVFGGYGHDLLEDTDLTVEELLAFALTVFEDRRDAEAAVMLVDECSYSRDEYLLPKADRKKAACARWIASADSRVHAVKEADVDDNENDAMSVSEAFHGEYMSWAGPLREGLRSQQVARAPGPRGG